MDLMRLFSGWLRLIILLASLNSQLKAGLTYGLLESTAVDDHSLQLSRLVISGEDNLKETLHKTTEKHELSLAQTNPAERHSVSTFKSELPRGSSQHIKVSGLENNLGFEGFTSNSVSKSRKYQGQSPKNREARAITASTLDNEILGPQAITKLSSTQPPNHPAKFHLIFHDEACLKFYPLLADNLLTDYSLQEAYTRFIRLMGERSGANNKWGLPLKDFKNSLAFVMKGSLTQVNAIMHLFSPSKLGVEEQAQELRLAFQFLTNFWTKAFPPNDQVRSLENDHFIEVVDQARAYFFSASRDPTQLLEASWEATKFWNSQKVSKLSELGMLDKRETLIDNEITKLAVNYYNSISVNFEARLKTSGQEDEFPNHIFITLKKRNLQ
ncbi:hypothetical protein O181_046918 [Austropuccinia psidii MF-1]|uniref:Uncharacterized protein n=1 Tax=Austropuccinia psidii MF-1 TaxID=1389203 RepID=A0A9Q3HJ06_9BASI|nr:hypothetical protein [Austropuccinia psidii MF-1]